MAHLSMCEVLLVISVVVIVVTVVIVVVVGYETQAPQTKGARQVMHGAMGRIGSVLHVLVMMPCGRCQLLCL